MATDTVSAFTPISLNFNKDVINGFALKCDNDLIFDEQPSAGDITSHGHHRYYKGRSDVGVHELLSLRECDEIQSMKLIEKEDLKLQENINIKSEESLLATTNCNNLYNGDGDSILYNNVDRQDEDPNMAKKKRNAKKRNRSDMPPEELMKLRERERKAQQSRRDRIRAQKRNAQGWHDDDAAWEAFLDQAENSGDPTDEQMKQIFANTVPPSMVCSISRDSPKDEVFVDDISPTELSMAMEVKTEFKEEKEEDSVLNDVSHHHNTLIQKQDSVHSNDTDTNSAGSYHDNQSVHYSSDDKPMDGQHNDDQKENGKKKLSRRHYLPHEELERLRKRERETKRRQRERHRLANMDSTSPVKSTSTLSSNDTEYIEESVNEAELKSSDVKKYDILPNGDHFKSIDQHHPPPESSVVPLVVPPKSALSTSESHHLAIKPHSHHIAGNHHSHYPPLVYMSNNKHRHHHYPSHSPTQYLGEGRHFPDVHFPRYVVDDRHYHSESYKLDGYKSHILPHVLPVAHHPSMAADSNGMTSPEHKPKLSSCVSPITVSSEKKKLISRNVDRKKLSEEELEDLRRRERDYQRERRARIRLEKAKLQANHDHYPHKSRDEGMPHYYHHTPMYRPHSSLHMYHDDLHNRDREKPIHVIPNYDSEDRLDYRQYSPRCHSMKSIDDRKDLSDSRYEGKPLSSSDDGKDSDLLQVVPKTRDCEDMSISPPQVTPNKGNISPGSSDSKKSMLEGICTNLIKKEPEESKESYSSYSGDTNDNDDCDDKLVIVQPNITPNKNETDIKREGDFDPSPERCKEETITENTFSTITSTKMARDDMSLRDKIMEDQLERRRRSNREAQRRRRARLKVQEHPEDRPNSAGEINDFDLVQRSRLLPMYGDDIKLSNHSSHMVPTKGCCMKVTPPLRPDSLYSDDYHGYHGHHNGKTLYNHNHIYDRYSGHGHAHELDSHQVEKHCYYSAHRSPKEVDSHRYPHYFREQSKIERYMHDLPVHYAHHGNESLRQHVDDYDVKKCARVPSIDNYDVYDEIHRNEIEKDVQKPPSSSESPSLMSTPRFENGNEMEPSKQCGRKRKQYAPRKVVSSSSASPEEDVDVCTVRESPEEKYIFKDRESQEENAIFDDRESQEENAVFKDRESQDEIAVFKDGESPVDKYNFKDGESPEDKYLFKDGDSPVDKYGFKDRESLVEKYIFRDSHSKECAPKVLQFNGDGNFDDSISTQQKLDDLLYPFR